MNTFSKNDIISSVRNSIVLYVKVEAGWESILKKVKNKLISDKSLKSKENIDFDDALKR